MVVLRQERDQLVALIARLFINEFIEVSMDLLLSFGALLQLIEVFDLILNQGVAVHKVMLVIFGDKFGALGSSSLVEIRLLHLVLGVLSL